MRQARFIRAIPAAMAITLAVVGTVATAAPVGPPGGTIYAHDQAYRTVATPADLPPHGMFDTIYVLGDGLANVSDAAPGDMEYNGGRWEVRPVTFVNIAPMQYTNAEDIEAAAEAGDISIGDPIRHFECPLIKKR
jgi:hypothetical protein